MDDELRDLGRSLRSAATVPTVAVLRRRARRHRRNVVALAAVPAVSVLAGAALLVSSGDGGGSPTAVRVADEKGSDQMGTRPSVLPEGSPIVGYGPELESLESLPGEGLAVHHLGPDGADGSRNSDPTDDFVAFYGVDGQVLGHVRGGLPELPLTGQGRPPLEVLAPARAGVPERVALVGGWELAGWTGGGGQLVDASGAAVEDLPTTLVPSHRRDAVSTRQGDEGDAVAVLLPEGRRVDLPDGCTVQDRAGARLLLLCGDETLESSDDQLRWLEADGEATVIQAMAPPEGKGVRSASVSPDGRRLLVELIHECDSSGAYLLEPGSGRYVPALGAGAIADGRAYGWVGDDPLVFSAQGPCSDGSPQPGIYRVTPQGPRRVAPFPSDQPATAVYWLGHAAER